MSLASSPPSSRLDADRLRRVLDGCGYRSTVVHLAGSRLLAPGCALSLQFGDRVGIDADGQTCLTIRGSLRLNGPGERAVGATYWQIRKPFHRLGGIDGAGLALEADLILADDITLADVLAHGGEAYRHLRLLLVDARDTLHGLPIDVRVCEEADQPALRIDARLFGDLVSGRSGLVASRGPRISARHQRLTSAACDWIMDEVLPDLARAVRAECADRSGYPLPDGAAPLLPEVLSNAGATGEFDDASIVPGLEPVL